MAMNLKDYYRILSSMGIPTPTGFADSFYKSVFDSPQTFHGDCDSSRFHIEDIVIMNYDRKIVFKSRSVIVDGVFSPIPV